MQWNFSSIKQIVIDAAKEWSEDKASRLGAALAYYTVFSIAPLLLITIAIVGFIYGEEAASGQIQGQVAEFVGPEGGKAIETMVANAGERKGAGIFATVISAALLLFGASGVFVQLKDALNTVWDVPEPKSEGGIWGFIKTRFMSFGLVLGVGFLLLVSLILSAILSSVGKFMGDALPMAALMQVLNNVLSFAVITALFAMIFKFLPDIKLPWRDVWIGAAITALLFTIGKWALGVYLGRSSMSSAYGAAGSFVVLLVWTYYSAQIVFFGAEVTQVYSHRYGAWQGRKKRTEKQKMEGVGPGGLEKTDSSDETGRVQEPLKPNPIGKAIGKAAGYAIAGKAVMDGLKDDKKR